MSKHSPPFFLVAAVAVLALVIGVGVPAQAATTHDAIGLQIGSDTHFVTAPDIDHVGIADNARPFSTAPPVVSDVRVATYFVMHVILSDPGRRCRGDGVIPGGWCPLSLKITGLWNVDVRQHG